MTDEIFKDLDQLISFLKGNIPTKIQVDIHFFKSLQKAGEKLDLLKKTLLLRNVRYSKSKDKFELDCENSNYSEELISHHGNELIENTDDFIRESILLLNELSAGYKEVIEEYAETEMVGKLQDAPTSAPAEPEMDDATIIRNLTEEEKA